MFDPKDSRTIGYHLFLLPTGELFDVLQRTITDLAQRYQGPVFDPHVTLLARISKSDEGELLAATEKLASLMTPFELELKDVDGYDAYFRALFWTAQPDDAIRDYHQMALDLFGVQDANPYMAHASLYYGNISKSTKDEMIRSLSLPARAIFQVDALYLYRTEGETQDWVRIATYPLPTISRS